MKRLIHPTVCTVVIVFVNGMNTSIALSLESTLKKLSVVFFFGHWYLCCPKLSLLIQNFHHFQNFDKTLQFRINIKYKYEIFREKPFHDPQST